MQISETKRKSRKQLRTCQKGLAWYSQGAKPEEYAAKNMLPARLSFKVEGEIKSSQDRQKLKKL